MTWLLSLVFWFSFALGELFWHMGIRLSGCGKVLLQEWLVYTDALDFALDFNLTIKKIVGFK